MMALFAEFLCTGFTYRAETRRDEMRRHYRRWWDTLGPKLGMGISPLWGKDRRWLARVIPCASTLRAHVHYGLTTTKLLIVERGLEWDL